MTGECYAFKTRSTGLVWAHVTSASNNFRWTGPFLCLLPTDTDDHYRRDVVSDCVQADRVDAIGGGMGRRERVREMTENDL